MNERDQELWEQALHDGERFDSAESCFADLIRADERERIKVANAPEIDRINTHIKNLEDAVKNEREACSKLADAASVYNRFISIKIASEIRARGNSVSSA